MAEQEITDLESLLERLTAICEDCREITLGQMMQAVGQRSFGAMLLLLGIIPASPLSGVPGLPTVVAIMVLLVAGQMLVPGSHFWLPRWLLRRSIPKSRFEQAVRFLLPTARFIDRLIRPRLTILTHDGGSYLVASLCLLIALTMPPLEIVPFANTMAGVTLAALGLGLIASDGVLILIAIGTYAAGAGFAFSALAG